MILTVALNMVSAKHLLDSLVQIMGCIDLLVTAVGMSTSQVVEKTVK